MTIITYSPVIFGLAAVISMIIAAIVIIVFRHKPYILLVGIVVWMLGAISPFIVSKFAPRCKVTTASSVVTRMSLKGLQLTEPQAKEVLCLAKEGREQFSYEMPDKTNENRLFKITFVKKNSERGIMLKALTYNVYASKNDGTSLKI